MRRYNAVFLDVDGTLLWVDLDIEGYVRDLKPYATNEFLTVEQAEGLIWESLRRHINENINYPTEEELAAFRRENALGVADSLGLDAPAEVLDEVMSRHILYNPYPEAEAVMKELKEIGIPPLYVVSNWDVALATVLDDLGWTRYMSGIVASAKIGSEKPDDTIFEEALSAAGLPRDRVVHVGNDPISDIQGAAGIDALLIDREGGIEAPKAVEILPDLRGLPLLVQG
ncbi:MAG TPA: HAD family hydrolase [Rubrobacteraceae bacterium]|nr:HAD family hydrolase [Rubrobacteraceae bacterium]